VKITVRSAQAASVRGVDTGQVDIDEYEIGSEPAEVRQSMLRDLLRSFRGMLASSFSVTAASSTIGIVLRAVE
jgi:hypothetical protein